jgi:hypothetical protein
MLIVIAARPFLTQARDEVVGRQQLALGHSSRSSPS